MQQLQAAAAAINVFCI